MAGVKFTIALEDAYLKDALVHAQAALQPQQFRSLLGQVGEYMVGSTRERAATETAPDGEQWVTLSPLYARRKEKIAPGAPLLVLEGHMLFTDLVWQLDGDDAVLVGTNAPYGATHQYGRSAIPPRPWLGTTEQDDVEILQRMHDYILQSFDGAAA